MANQFDDVQLDPNSFSFIEAQGRDQWDTFGPSFGSLTVVGTLTAIGRIRFVGRWCQFQVQFSAATSIASVAGTDYFTLPVPAMGLAGIATMTNLTTNVAVGVCHVDVVNSRCYLPTQIASANVFTICGSYET